MMRTIELTEKPTLGLGEDFLNNVIRLNVATHGVKAVIQQFPGQIETAYRFGSIDVLREHPELLVPERLEQKPYLSCWVMDKNVRDFWSERCVYTPKVCSSLLHFDPNTLLKMPIENPLLYGYLAYANEFSEPYQMVNIPELPERDDLSIPWNWNKTTRDAFAKSLSASPVDGWLIMEFYERFVSNHVSEAYTDRKESYKNRIPLEKIQYWTPFLDTFTRDGLIDFVRQKHKPVLSELDINDIDFAGSTFSL